MDENKYEVALSFAGEDREYVHQVAEHLRAAGVRVFYDKFEETNLWGKNLYDYLQDVYSSSSSYSVLFISKYYAKKLWTNHERESAQERAFSERREYILPARFDDTEIPGLKKTTGYINLNEKTPYQFAELISKKIDKGNEYFSDNENTDNAIVFKDISHHHKTFIGLLIFRGIRAWCVAIGVTEKASNTHYISENLCYQINPNEAFKSKQETAIQIVTEHAKDIASIGDMIGSPIALVYPLTINQETYDRFLQTDQKYILNTKTHLKSFSHPVSSSEYTYILDLKRNSDISISCLKAPADYLKDAYGIEFSVIEDDEEKHLVIKEDAFARNSKYLVIEANSGRLVGSTGIGRDLQLSVENTFSDIDRKSITQSIKSHRTRHLGFRGSVLLETPKQQSKRKENVQVECTQCQDEKQLVVEYNLRKYRVPCPKCNRNENMSWKAFGDLFDNNGVVKEKQNESVFQESYGYKEKANNSLNSDAKQSRSFLARLFGAD